MTVEVLASLMSLEALSLDDKEAEIDGAYAGDFLSWVMGRTHAGNVWLTIMTNINVVAVASLIGMSCVIICENAELPAETLEAARLRGINLLRTKKTLFSACVEVGRLLEI